MLVKAYSRRDPLGNSRGKFDSEAQVGKNGKIYVLGYKLHITTTQSPSCLWEVSLHLQTLN
jgi:hypothetical protein